MVEGRDAGTCGGHSLKSADTEECFRLLHVFSLAVAALVVLYALEHAVGTANTEKTLDIFPFLRNKERNTFVHASDFETHLYSKETLNSFLFLGKKARNTCKPNAPARSRARAHARTHARTHTHTHTHTQQKDILDPLIALVSS